MKPKSKTGFFSSAPEHPDIVCISTKGCYKNKNKRYGNGKRVANMSELKPIKKIRVKRYNIKYREGKF